MLKGERKLDRSGKSGAVQEEGALPISMIPGLAAGNASIESRELPAGKGASRNSDLPGASSVAGLEGQMQEEDIASLRDAFTNACRATSNWKSWWGLGCWD
jgi:hypothetical protein